MYELRGVKMMLERDLAVLYNVETRVLIQATKRNPERFPPEFMFQITSAEFEIWKSQIVMSNSDKMGLRRPPYVFTEQGVAMLSAVLKSETAIKVSINIMKAFVAARQYFLTYQNNQMIIDDVLHRLQLLEKFNIKIIQDNEETLKAVNELSEDFGKEFDNIYYALSQLAEKPKTEQKRKRIGFDATNEV
ncbi:MAG: ORF6N domain-containing protein [Paludibacteraceae bacterium]